MVRCCVKFSEIAKRIVSYPGRAVSDSYKAGYDCGKNGPNTTNCHFGFFGTEEHTRAWEEGKRKAESDVKRERI